LEQNTLNFTSSFFSSGTGLLGLLFAERILPIPPSDAALKADCTNFCRFWVWYEWETNVGIFGIAYCEDIILVLNFKIRKIREMSQYLWFKCHHCRTWLGRSKWRRLYWGWRRVQRSRIREP